MNVSSGRALVTGAAGFIGGHLVQRLAAEGFEVVGLDIKRERRPLPDGARLVNADIRDAGRVAEVMAEVRPDVVYHLAAQTSVTVSMREPDVDVETNIIGTLNLARAAIDHGVRRLVFFSTGGAIFGAPERLPVNERTPTAPLSPYGLSKLTAERYVALMIAAEDASLEFSVVRPGNVYGPWQDPHGEAGVVAIFAMRMLANEPATIYGDGGQRRDYVYVEDVVDAAFRAGTLTPATCLVGTGVATSTQEVFEAIAGASNYERPAIYAPERPGDIPQIALDATRARQMWDWSPQVEFREGIQRTVDWFRTQSS